MVGDIKPRHYSIASAQSVVGNRVDLLIVTVDWVTSSGMFHYSTVMCGPPDEPHIRFPSLWPMHSLSQWPEGRPEGNSIHQAKCHEGSFMHAQYTLDLTFVRLVTPRQHAAFDHGRSWYRCCSLPRIPPTSRYAFAAEYPCWPRLLLLRLEAPVSRIFIW